MVLLVMLVVEPGAAEKELFPAVELLRQNRAYKPGTCRIANSTTLRRKVDFSRISCLSPSLKRYDL